MNGKKQAVLCVLLSVMIGTCVFIVNIAPVESSVGDSGYYVTLELSHYRDDVLLEKRVIEDDYILRNFVHMWLNILSGSRYVDAFINYKTVDVDNIERTPVVSKVYFANSLPQIRLGTGNNPVAVTDYQLQTQVLSQVIDDVEQWFSGNQFNVTADTTIVSDGTYSITESGLTIALYDVVTARQTLICRDTFSAINVINGDIIVVRYIFRFNVGV